MKKSLIALGLALIAVGGLFLPVYGLDDKKPLLTKPPKAIRWEKDIRLFEQWDSQNAWPVHPVLFVGSSSIKKWLTREDFPHLPVINRGFGGSQISDVVYYTSRIVLKYQPSVIVFYCGDNDIAAGKTPGTVLADYQHFVKLVHKKLPETKIVFISIKPSGSRWSLWPQMNQANELIRHFSLAYSYLVYVDCGSCLLKDGKPDDSLFLKDRLHLNRKGYRLWRDLLAPVIDRLRIPPRRKKGEK